MKHKKPRILVTGATGFLGKYVMGALVQEGAEAIPISKSLGYDLRNEAEALQAVMVAKPDGIVHLAATCGGIGANMKAPATFITDNLRIGLNVVHAASVGNAHLTLIGTVCSYAKDTPVPFKEEDYWNGYPEPTNAPYGIAKKTIGVVMQAYRQQFGLKGVHLIPANLYGPGDHFEEESSHVIPAMIRRFVEAEKQAKETVACWGTGAATRSFLHARDAASAIAQAAISRYDFDDVINLPGSEEISISEISQLIALATGYKGKVTWDATKPDGQPRRAIDGTRAYEHLEWGPAIGLAEGLKETVDWYKAQIK
jgi:GDP-L-fucose synthase